MCAGLARNRRPDCNRQRGRHATGCSLIGATKSKQPHILTALTLDDQAETVLIRMSRGSGIAGLGAMARMTKLPGSGDSDIQDLSPLLDIPKSRLIATLRAAKVPFADDPSNRDPRFTQCATARANAGTGAGKGWTLVGFHCWRAGLSARIARSKRGRSGARRVDGRFGAAGTHRLRRYGLFPIAAEIALRLVGRAVAKAGNEGPGRNSASGGAESGARYRPKTRPKTQAMSGSEVVSPVPW